MHKIAHFYVKIGLWILTTNSTKIALLKKYGVYDVGSLIAYTLKVKSIPLQYSYFTKMAFYN